MALDEVMAEEAEDEDAGLDAGSGTAVNDVEVLPLTSSDLVRVEEYLRSLEGLPDSKFERL